MKITEPWIENQNTQDVCRAVMAEGAQIYFVGGCVRNALLGVGVSDLDLSTDATPDQVLSLAEKAGIRAVPTGIDHGTVTLIKGGIPHEITTFRKDVATDGRRAVVAFSKDMTEDAARRDFTMNAIYARPDGEVVDPLGGVEDLQAHLVRFIGTAENRIREDYLRSLRYFRFHAWYGNSEAGFDPEALAAIAANLEGISTLSRERVGMELLKLLAAPNPAPEIAVMRQIGILGQILPGADDRALAPLIHLEAGLPPDPVRRLAALGGDEAQKLLRLSKVQARKLDGLRNAIGDSRGIGELAYRMGADFARDAGLLRAALLEHPLPQDMETDIATGASAIFPVAAQDLMPNLQGAQLGAVLKKLESQWISSGFSLSRDTLLAQIK